MNPSSMSRRDFLWRASLAAISTGALVEHAWGQETPQYVIAETIHGKVRGIDNRGIKTFKAIPYGASTGGANRFMPPVDPASWDGVRDALEWGHNCPQNDPATAKPAAAGNSQSESEDCLVLNVWTPALNDGGKRPVMLWIHGGGFGSGSGSGASTDGTNLARRGDVVTLSINHRLNVLGFGNFSELNPDFAASGDVGMLDIVHALKWVRANIEQFGGDPNMVTIYGESGGGQKIEIMLAMPSAKGLFHRAVIESGISIRVVERDIATRNAKLLLKQLGISRTDVRQAQQLPLNQIMAAYFAVYRELGSIDPSLMGFSPCIDPIILPQHPFHPTASRISADIPVIIGSNSTEMTLFAAPPLFRMDEDAMKAQAKKLLGAHSEETISVYRKASPGATPSDIYLMMLSDFKFNAVTWKIAERRAALGQGPVYLYYFAWESPLRGGLFRSPHGMEIPFVFDNVQTAVKTGQGPEAFALADKVSDAWIAFARTANPDTPKLPHWPPHTVADRATMILNNESKVVNDPLRDQRIAMFRALHLS
jgi:para-nitrobenzyl esterase